MTTVLEVTGYTDRWVASCGDRIDVHAASSHPAIYWHLVRHLGSIDNPGDWKVKTAEIAACAGRFDTSGACHIGTGSWFSAEIQDHEPADGYQFDCNLLPTRLCSSRTLIARLEFATSYLELLANEIGELQIAISASGIHPFKMARLAVGDWMPIRLEVLTGTNQTSVLLECGGLHDRLDLLGEMVEGPLVRLYLAGDGKIGYYDGKIEGPALRVMSERPGRGRQIADLASWSFSDFSLGQDRVPNIWGGADGVFHNAPTRAVTSSRFRGQSCNFLEAPEAYDAVWFHRDDLSDAGWPLSASIEVPELESGAYSLVLSACEKVDWDDRASFDALPIFIRPARTSRHEVALVLPTFSYRAYANNTFAEDADPAIFQRKKASVSKPLYDTAIALNLLSLYSLHLDGSGVCLSSLKRPQLTIRADFDSQLQGFPHQFSADLAIVQWLEELNVGYDILTDEVLHEEGAETLANYKVVVTGSHPEYASAASLDAWRDYSHSGGSILYLGGNGFYWSVGLDARHPELLEVRRSEGTRTWTAGIGERRQQLDGNDGGIWRSLGRPPNAIFGVGFCAHGFSGDGTYSATGAHIPTRFRNLGKFFAEQGHDPFGIAGLEIDRYSAEFGSPHNTIILASTEFLPQGYLPTVEEFGGLDELLLGADAALTAKVRGDIVLRQTPQGGHVFSTGSIRWASGLTDPDDKARARALTTAVLYDFLA